jgi:hypothetical protein
LVIIHKISIFGSQYNKSRIAGKR